MIVGHRELDLALNVARMPTLAAAMRERPLPPDTLVLIRIAAGCVETAREAAEITGMQPGSLREAAVFYLQQVLLADGSDSYRVLGVLPEATRTEMREHLRWLMKWLHPDRNPNDWESVFAERVLKAWRDAGSARPEAERAHVRSPEPRDRRSRRHGRRARQIRWIALPIEASSSGLSGKRTKIAAAVIVATLGLVLVSYPYRLPLGGWLGFQTIEARTSAQHAD